MNEQEEVRGRILEMAYQIALEAGGVEDGHFEGDEVASALDLDQKHTRDALTSLKAKGLLETATAFLGGGELLRITPYGFQEVERLRNEGNGPAAPDAAPAAGSIFVTVNGDVHGQAIQGAGSTAHITQHHNAINPEVLELLERILVASREVDNDELRAEAVEGAEALASELKAEQPDLGRARTLARGFWSIAQRAETLSGLASNLMTLLGAGE